MVDLLNFNLEEAYASTCTSNAKKVKSKEEYESLLEGYIDHLEELEDSQEYHHLLALGKALASEVRIKILLYLYLSKSSCFCELTGLFNIQDSTLTYHIKLLKAARLVKTTKNGKYTIVKIASNIQNKIPKSVQTLFA